MKKDTFYFTHDFNAQGDPKHEKLIYEMGWEGYGIFWALIEKISQETGKWKLEKDYARLSFALHTDEKKINHIIENLNLFKTDEKYFWSERLLKHFEERKEKSDKAKKSAEDRWGKDEKRKMTNDCIFYVIRVFNDDEQFLKVGTTSESVSRRYSGKLNGYKYELVFLRESQNAKCCEIKSEICEKFKRYIPSIEFAGMQECYNTEDLKKIKEFAMRHKHFRNAIKERKGKEIKVKEKKEEDKKLTPKQITKLFFENKNNQEEIIKKIVHQKQIPASVVRNEVQKFINYWTESTQNGTKQRWETQKTFEVYRRLATWFANANKFKATAKKSAVPKNF